MLGTTLLIFGTKQLRAAAVAWLQSESPSTLYLSHPISSARRQYIDKGEWPTLVGEVNAMQSLFLDRDDDKNKMVVVMPTAIDERRLAKSFPSGLMQRQTLLEKRWPLSAAEEQLLYRSPVGATDPDHTSVLEYNVLKGDKVIPLSAGYPGYKPSTKTQVRADALLSSFEQAFHRHLTARDYGLVSLTDSMLVFGHSSSGPSRPTA